jgi:hypothetical protein
LLYRMRLRSHISIYEGEIKTPLFMYLLLIIKPKP